MARRVSYEGLVNLYLRWREQGLTGRQLHARADERVPGQSPEDKASAAEDSLRRLHVLRRARMLAEGTPISQAFGAEGPPSESVTVRVLVRMRIAGQGGHIYRTIVQTVPVGTAASDVVGAAVAYAEGVGTYGTVEEASGTIIGPLWDVDEF